MEIITELSSLKGLSIEAITIGNFDGLHLGHLALIKELKSRKAQKKSLLITFDPHPREFFNSGSKVPRLSTWPELVQEFQKQKIDVVLRLRFDLKLSKTTAEEFMTQIWQSTQFKHLIVGHDFALGANRQGNAKFLKSWCETRGLSFHQVDSIEVNTVTISSQKIREYLGLGKVQEAQALLGHFYRIRGDVIRGDGRGRQLQFPTANLNVDESKIRPALGVYGGKAYVGKKELFAVCNIGKRPTFKPEQSSISVEVHFLDFEGDLYGQEVTFEFHFRIREEKRFGSKEELISQIKNDIEYAKVKLEK